MDDKNKDEDAPHTTKGTVGSTLGGAVAGAVAGTALGAPVVGTVIGAVSGAVIWRSEKAGCRNQTKEEVDIFCARRVVKEKNFSDCNETEDEVGIGCDEETIAKQSSRAAAKKTAAKKPVRKGRGTSKQRRTASKTGRRATRGSR
jgi:hypothetical protein